MRPNLSQVCFRRFVWDDDRSCFICFLQRTTIKLPDVLCVNLIIINIYLSCYILFPNEQTNERTKSCQKKKNDEYRLALKPKIDTIVKFRDMRLNIFPATLRGGEMKQETTTEYCFRVNNMRLSMKTATTVQYSSNCFVLKSKLCCYLNS